MYRQEITTFFGEHLNYGLTITLRYPKKDMKESEWLEKYQEFIQCFLGIINPSELFLEFSYIKQDILPDGSVEEDFVLADDMSGFDLSTSEILRLNQESVAKLIPGAIEVIANYIHGISYNRLVVPPNSLLLSGENHEYTYPSEDYGDGMGYILEDGEGFLIERYTIDSHPTGTLEHIEATIDLRNTVFWESDYLSKKIVYCLNSLTEKGWKIESVPHDIAILLNHKNSG